MKTTQQLFDQSCIGLLIQGKQSMSHGEQGVCAYNGENGCKCAVGQVLPEGIDTRIFEGVSLMTNVNNVRKERVIKRRAKLLDALTLGGVDVNDTQAIAMLSDLQQVHDYAYEEGDMFRRQLVRSWEKVAIKYGLTMLAVREEARKYVSID